MKPVAIFKHAATEGPGYFATYLDRNRVPWQVIDIGAGEPDPLIRMRTVASRLWEDP